MNATLRNEAKATLEGFQRLLNCLRPNRGWKADSEAVELAIRRGYRAMNLLDSIRREILAEGPTSVIGGEDCQWVQQIDMLLPRE